MAKTRVYELAKEYDMQSKDFVVVLNQHGVPVKNHMSVLTDLQVSQFKLIYEAERAQGTAEKKVKEPKEKEQKAESKPKAASESKNKVEARPAVETQKKPKTESGKTEVKAESDARKMKEKPAAKKPNPEKRTDNREQRAPKYRSEEEKGGAERFEKKKQFSDNKRPSSGPSKDQPKKAAKSFNDSSKNYQRGNSDFSEQNQNGSNKFGRKNNKDKKHDGSRYSDGKKGKNSNISEPIVLKDHSKKGKTSRSAYKKIKAETKSEKQKNQIFSIPEILTVGELAEIFDIDATEIIKTLMMAGTMATINQQIDYDTAALVADELGYNVEVIKMEDVVSKILEEYDEQDTGNQVKRPPVVTVMGHVDHGKTSLLDRIRKANVTAGEAGGITQHIGAYTVKINNESITFIDTPGHEAFTAMRSRGAMMTDIAVLVVAADDGVMPQTVEAINHSKAAGVPIIVAINKIDKDGANPDRVKQELTEHNILVEEWGGDVIAVPVSAKKGINIEELLDNILLVAEMEELTADPKRAARGCVIESQLKKGKGATASLLVQQGTLNVGDCIISGTTYGKVRTMIDDKGRRIKKAGPSVPVEISGLSDLPAAGDDFIVLADEKEARQLAEKRMQMQKDQRQAKTKMSLDDLFSRIQEGQIQDINIIIKADVQGSIEAIAQSLIKLSTDEVRINVIHSAVGAINETDVMLASTSDAIIIGFNVRPDKNAVAAAESEKVDIRLYRVIYDAIEDVKKAMEGMLAPEYIERVTATAEVRDTFRIPNGSTIAGCYVTEGKINRNDEVRVIRDGIVVFEGMLASLRRFKDDVKEVSNGFECGLGIERYNDIKVGDVIETFVMDAVAREL